MSKHRIRTITNYNKPDESDKPYKNNDSGFMSIYPCLAPKHRPPYAYYQNNPPNSYPSPYTNNDLDVVKIPQSSALTNTKPQNELVHYEDKDMQVSYQETRRATIDSRSDDEDDHELTTVTTPARRPPTRYVMKTCGMAVLVVVSITLFAIMLSCATEIHLNVMQVRNDQLSYYAKLGAEHCVFYLNPGSERFQNSSDDEKRRLMQAGFNDCKEAEKFLSTVFWRYISAVIDPFALCSSLESCHSLFWQWFAKLSGIIMFSGASYYLLPLLSQFLFYSFRRM